MNSIPSTHILEHMTYRTVPTSVAPPGVIERKLNALRTRKMELDLLISLLEIDQTRRIPSILNSQIPSNMNLKRRLCHSWKSLVT